MSELHDWWMSAAERDAKVAVAKADEYGSYDLLLLGKMLADMVSFPLDPGESPEETYAELGVLFYAAGKVARWVGAVKEGRRPSDDTIQDLKIYVTMVQRVRSAGGWPYGSGERYSDGQPKGADDA